MKWTADTSITGSKISEDNLRSSNSSMWMAFTSA